MASSSQNSRFYNVPSASHSQAGLIPYPEESSLLDRHGTYNLDRATHPIPRVSSPEPSPQLPGSFTPDPSWMLLESDLSLKQALNSHYPHSNRSTSFNRRSKPLLIIASLLPTLAATAQLLLLVYLLDVYTSLPSTANGSRPRISPVYSIWPYIACVGSLRLTAYKIFGMVVAILYTSTFIADMYINYDIRPGKWLRWLRLLLGTISSGTLIAIVFASADPTSHVHLYLVSVQGLTLATVKSLTWAIDYTLRQRYSLLKTDGKALLAKWWRFVVYTLGTPVGLLTVIGIYVCRNTGDIQTKGTACYVLTAISAICDWVYQLIGVAFLISLAYDLYQAEHFANLRLRSDRRGEDQRASTSSGRSHKSSVQYSRV